MCRLNPTTIFIAVLINCLILPVLSDSRTTYETTLKSKLTSLRSSTASSIARAKKSLESSHKSQFSQDVKKTILVDGLKSVREDMITGMESSTIPFYLKDWNCTKVSAEDENSIQQQNNQLLAGQRQLESQIHASKATGDCPQTEKLDELNKVIKIQVERIEEESKQFCVDSTQPGVTSGTSPSGPVGDGGNPNSGNPNSGNASGGPGGSQYPTSGTTQPGSSSSPNTSPAGTNTGSTNSPGNGVPSSPNTSNQQPGTYPSGTNYPSSSNGGVYQPGVYPSGTTSGSNTSPGPTTGTTNNGGNTSTTGGTSGSQQPLTGGSTPGQPIYINNLENPARNWVFGNINTTKFYQQVNDKVQKGAILCPQSTPYLSPIGECISCEHIYDVAVQQCASCPSGSSLNTNIHQCDTTQAGNSQLRNNNPQVGNFIGNSQYIQNAKSCHIQTPYFDGTKCVSCSPPNYFDVNNHLCLACGQDLTFDSILKECVPPKNSVTPEVPIFNSNLADDNYAGEPSNHISGAETCPQKQPYFNGLNCISCSLPLFFNFTAKVCSSCQSHYKFDPSTRECQVDESQVYYSSSLNTVNNYIGSPPMPTEPNQQLIKSCPFDKPYSQGRQCVACPLPRFFNFQTNHCELCTPPMTFDSQQGRCKAPQSSEGGYNSNLEQARNFMYQMPAYQPSQQSCPVEAPYFNGNSCTQCPLPEYFNFKTSLCESCPSGFTFNSQSRQCTTLKPSHATNLDNPNIYYNGDYQHLVNSVKTQQLQDHIIQCPSNTPFFDATRNQCISCPSDAPLYNIKHNTCTKCEEDSWFDPVSRICRYNQGVNLSLARNFMNTIGF